MAKWKSAFDATDEPEAAGGDFQNYDGPELPFSGVFPFVIKLARMKENSKGDDMIFMVLNVDAPDKEHDKHKYHGAPLFVNLNQTEQGAPYTKAFLDALGVKWRDFVAKTILDENDPPNITRLGMLKMDGDTPVRVSLRREKARKGPDGSSYPARAGIGGWLPAADPAADQDGDYDAEEGDDSTAPF